ncbi:hypothetical protein [Polymorphospora rubra]|nr:hypothetical protein [Polymorphospora rubra]
MEFFVLLVFVGLLALASVVGVTSDTRDSADWKPTDEGQRWQASA